MGQESCAELLRTHCLSMTWIMRSTIAWKNCRQLGKKTSSMYLTASSTHWQSTFQSDNLERFRFRFILCNPKIRGDATKKSICKMFESACPTFVKHRWGYRYEVLKWMSTRSEFLMWLDPTSIGESRSAEDNFGDPDYVFTDELRCLKILFTDKSAAACFWGLANAMRLLCEWGHDLSGWLHGCYCHPTKEDPCHMQFNTFFKLLLPTFC